MIKYLILNDMELYEKQILHNPHPTHTSLGAIKFTFHKDLEKKSWNFRTFSSS